MPMLLVLLLVIPLAAAVAVALLGSRRPDAVRWVSLAATLAGLALAAVVAVQFIDLTRREPLDERAHTFQPRMAVQCDLLTLHQAVADHPPTSIQFYLAVDGLNLWLVVLTALLMVCAILGSWTSVKERDNEFFAWLLALQTVMTGVFLAFDIVLFYVFFELTLVPLFFLIGIWGGPQRQYAARKFFIFTLTGSLLTLVGVFGAVLAVANDPYASARTTATTENATANELTFSIPRLVELVHGHTADLAQDVKARTDKVRSADEYKANEEKTDLKKANERLTFWRWVEVMVFAAMMIGFAVKVPLFPLHTWLPLAHTEAPTAGSVLLAGVLLKIGAYGFLRLCIPLAPDASLSFGTPLIGWLAVVGVLYGSCCALAQDDIKKLVAYSSVAHLGFCMLGLFALNEAGISGSLLQMINHGLSTGALFLLVGMLYERYHTRQMADYGGMASRMKVMAAFWVFITMASIGLPGLNGFVSETLSMMGMYAFQRPEAPGWLFSGLATSGIVLGAWYMLKLLRRVFFGELKEPHHDGHGAVPDLNGREIAALAPLAALCLFLGVWSQSFLDTVRPDLMVVARIAEGAKARSAGWNAQIAATAPPAAAVAESGELAP